MKQNKKISIQAAAKLNLYLEVLGKIDGGKFHDYHQLESQVVFLNLADELTFEEANELEISGTKIKDNIILKTAQAMQKEFKFDGGAKIILQKSIPLSAGLGGGSADAAATIVALNKLWDLNSTDSNLYAIAQEIGADVPCCLYSHIQEKNSVKFSGVGEVLTESELLEQMHFVLINPLKELSTPRIFAGIESYRPASDSTNFYECRNDLQHIAEKTMPEISGILESLQSEESCQLSRMTGSGATCFGIFSDEISAKNAEQNLKNHFPNYWVQYSNLK